MTLPGETPVQSVSSAPKRFTLQRIIIISAAALIGVLVLLFVLTLLLAANNIEQTEQVVRMLRDLMIIFLALEGILVILALTILILQIAQLVNVLQNEVKPILENTQEAVESASTTIKFVSKNVTAPLVSFKGYTAGLTTFVAQGFGLRKAVKYSRDEEQSSD